MTLGQQETPRGKPQSHQSPPPRGQVHPYIPAPDLLGQTPKTLTVCLAMLDT